EFLDKPYPFDNVLNAFFRIGFGIALGLFLFILFFQPFELDNTDVNNYILTIAGFSGITFLLIGVLQIILPWSFPKRLNKKNWDLKREIIVQLLLWVLNSVAWAFYIVYVAGVKLSMYLEVKIVLLSLAPPMIILYIKEVRSLRMQVDGLKVQQREKRQEHIELVSENRSEKLSIESGELILVKSAENYVEIQYLAGGTGTKKLLRATFKNIEDQLKPFSQMIRCHRTYIINMDHVIKMHREYGRIYLKMNGIEEDVPVSRQYLLGIKNALGSD
ncbi:MAG: LytTR family transcriptional regulator, partial [Bacteroidales bacterium]|nr:LytTR family transcriptional regulator [Bacteroidales bacterium]